MKAPGRLYIKIFISFIVFLIITEIAILGFYILFSGRYNSERFKKQNLEKLAIALQLTEKEIKSTRLPLQQDNNSVQELLERLGIALRAKIWLTGTDGHLLLKSFPENIPFRTIERIVKKVEEHKNARFFKHSNYYSSIYFTRQLITANSIPFHYHILFTDHLPPPHHGFEFAIGLLGIGIIAALLVIPISRQISRPVNSLTQSAQTIEQGDLSHRANITTKDEIGELGWAFNRMADKVESMVRGGRELTAQISHELRSPLARIQLSVEMIRDSLAELKDPDTRQNLKSIQEDIEELDQLIGRILQLSKLDLHETDYSADLFSPVEEIELQLDKYQAIAEKRSIRIRTEFTATDKILGNLENFGTVVTNLVDNAVKYAHDQSEITAGSRREGERLVITIANPADDVDSESLDRIFDPFFRVNPEEGDGMGLGLAFTRRIVEKHGGTISVQQKDRKIEFELRLPIMSASATPNVYKTA